MDLAATAEYSGRGVPKTPGETPGKTLGKTPVEILALLRSEPESSIPEIAARLGKSESAIERAIRKLKSTGALTRVGADKGGHWQVTGVRTTGPFR